MPPRTYLITASTGIGADTARLLAKQGENLFIVSRTQANCQALAQELGVLGGQADFYAGDLSDPMVAPKAVLRCVERFGRIDGLYNVAGISGRKFGDGPLHICTEDGWQHVIDVNLTTQYRMCREVVRVMRGQNPQAKSGQRGVILNMASILGIHPEPRHFSTIAYAASKGGIIAMTRAAAAFYAPEKIRFNVVAPALVHTAMSARASQDAQVVDFISSKQPLTAGFIASADVAQTSVFLLGDMSRAITGEVLEVDAGWNLT